MESGDWQQPSEAEMKIIQARRERSDTISNIMGSYLLKGYRMLDSLCPNCKCILLQKPTSDPSDSPVLYCVACSEVDCSDVAKDDPVYNEVAANKTVNEYYLRERQTSTTSEKIGTSSNMESLDSTLKETLVQLQLKIKGINEKLQTATLNNAVDLCAQLEVFLTSVTHVNAILNGSK